MHHSGGGGSVDNGRGCALWGQQAEGTLEIISVPSTQFYCKPKTEKIKSIKKIVLGLLAVLKLYIFWSY